jgi:ElaB/YqjD/DUF883 family membrane-anchored ribosome-binding protein
LEERIEPSENEGENMHKTNSLHQVTDDAKDHVVAAIESVKARATATAEEVGRAARKTIHDAEDATEEALSDAASRARSVRSEIAVYLREQAINTLIVAVVTGLLMSLVLLFLRSNRK